MTTITPRVKITAQVFREKTGRDPVMDDLDRVNCDKYPEIGHWGCGWCEQCGPRFQCRMSPPVCGDIT